MKTCEEMYQEIQPLIENDWHEAAIKALEKLLESHPDFAQGHNALGVLYHKLGLQKEALTHLSESINTDPDNITFLKNMADFCYSEMGEVKKAFETYQRVLDIQPDDVDALLILGHISVSEHRFDDAKEYYKKVLDIEPWNDDVSDYLSKLETCPDVSAGEIAAEGMYQKCLETANSGRQEDAVDELEKLLQVYPDFGPAHNDLGVLYYQLGDKEKALTYYEKAVTQDPDNSIFQKNLADFYYLELGRVEDALEIYAKVLTKEPDDIDCLMAAAHICEALEIKKDAMIFYDRILDIEPWNLEVSEKLDALNASKNRENSFNVPEGISTPIGNGLDVSFGQLDLD